MNESINAIEHKVYTRHYKEIFVKVQKNLLFMSRYQNVEQNIIKVDKIIRKFGRVKIFGNCSKNQNYFHELKSILNVPFDLPVPCLKS